MIILGLHFGHDAAVSVIKDGEVLICFEKERISRIRYAVGLTFEDIDLCLKDVGLTIDDIDYAAVTTTQEIEYVFSEKNKLDLNYERHDKHSLPCAMTDTLNATSDTVEEREIGNLYNVLKNEAERSYHRSLPGGKKLLDTPDLFMGNLEHFIDIPLWSQVRKLSDIAQTDYSSVIENKDIQFGFHYPSTLNVKGKKIPAYIFSHHHAHTAYAFYESPFEDAAIFSIDGGGAYGYLGGMFSYGNGNSFSPFTPHHLNLGPFYDLTAMDIGLGLVGGAGKLMGLSAYGKPKMFNRDFVGNWYDCGEGYQTHEDWIKHYRKEAARLGYDVSPIGDKNRILEPVNVDIAASTQKIVEESMLQAVSTLKSTLLASGHNTENLCLTGGVALNCPANTRIYNESAFENLFVPPAVSDMGLSIGSALFLYHGMLDQPRKPKPASPKRAYLGLNSSHKKDLVEKTLDEYKDKINFEKKDNHTQSAAQALKDDKVIAWFEGRSEVGPRALGHRSILANPRYKKNWVRINDVKGREHWRPFAPAVLEERAEEFFKNTQLPSHYMLLNADVRSSELPVITHVDGSARVQSVNSDCGHIYEMLQEFDKIEGIPVVLNTSFNGPGEPIVETPKHAIEFLLNTKLDYLYLEGYEVTRK